MIEIKNLRFGYKKDRVLFNNLQLEVNPGSIYGLLGKNGAGKTTLLKQMTGLLFPDHGECLLFGEAACKRLPSTLSEIFFLTEEFYLPPLKLNEFIKFNAVFYPLFDKNQFEKYLTEFEITGNPKLQTLSYGQKKKFMIAFGLAANTKLLLFDEPTNGLDIPSKSQFRRIIASSLTDDRSIIISTHQVRDLASLIDHVTILEGGKIVFNKSTMEISDKLAFLQTREKDLPHILYSEEILGGLSVISLKKETETEIDLELLFNGIMTHTSEINSAFNN